MTRLPSAVGSGVSRLRRTSLKRTTTFVIGLLVCVSATMAVACSDSGISDEDYADRVEELEGDFVDRGNDVEAGDTQLETFEKQVDALRDYTDGYTDLDAPGDVSDEHDAFVDALKDVLEEAEDVLAEAEDARDDEDAAAIIDDYLSSDTRADEDLGDACRDVQDAADDADINADYQCPG